MTTTDTPMTWTRLAPTDLLAPGDVWGEDPDNPEWAIEEEAHDIAGFTVGQLNGIRRKLGKQPVKFWRKQPAGRGLKLLAGLAGTAVAAALLNRKK